MPSHLFSRPFSQESYQSNIHCLYVLVSNTKMYTLEAFLHCRHVLWMIFSKCFELAKMLLNPPLQNDLLIQVWLRTEVPSTPSLTRPGFELMTSRSWLYISCHWGVCSNHLATSDFKTEMYCHILSFSGLGWFQMHGLSDRLMHWQLIFWFKYDLGQKYHAPQIQTYDLHIMTVHFLPGLLYTTLMPFLNIFLRSWEENILCKDGRKVMGLSSAVCNFSCCLFHTTCLVRYSLILLCNCSRN